MYVYIVPRWDDWAKNLWALGNGTRKFVAQSPSHPVTEWYLGPPRYEVSSCLVQDPSTMKLTCRFQYSPYIMVTICLMNFIKVSTMVVTWLVGRKKAQNQESVDAQTLCTLGDAIASFMRESDPATKNMCLATKDDFSRARSPWYSWRSKPLEPAIDSKEFRKEPKRWMQATRKRRWILLIAMCLLTIMVGGALLAASLDCLHHRNFQTTMADLASLGFGALTPYTYLVTGLPRNDPAGLISNVLVANLPQLLLSMLYMLFNAMLSTFLVQREFSLMHKAEKRKPLRVSEPIGIQRRNAFSDEPELLSCEDYCFIP
ncbi:hypothetical protein TOPH_03288 [Tolypocladium ophioglossoides CBS 100239]|uniref:Uncharacterized protein n=1 Tax=Tolypocladium ophioglossoides (strain CBS 100239) TaxID=1163406 RepID=A0A0L0ND95_TOLOC|nr:hypothetical protein TOPH_03288 [Tolypocladium ophioglossoides CBS 100239]